MLNIKELITDQEIAGYHLIAAFDGTQLVGLAGIRSTHTTEETQKTTEEIQGTTERNTEEPRVFSVT